MKLRPAEHQLLERMVKGATLKSHRDLDGRKIYLLHHLEECPPITISPTLIETLYQQGLIESNQKFPAATYLLTDKGRKKVTAVVMSPLTTEGWNQ